MQVSNEENTQKLLNSISEKYTPIEDSLVKNFSGIDGCKRLRELCEKHNIVYRFTNY